MSITLSGTNISKNLFHSEDAIKHKTINDRYTIIINSTETEVLVIIPKSSCLITVIILKK